MNFMVDAQLPHLLAVRLRELDHHASHTLDLEEGNRTSDETISNLATRSGAVVITKDRDFLDSHLLTGSPPRLLMVTTGNLPNRELLTLFENHITLIVGAFDQADWVEINAGGLIIHS